MARHIKNTRLMSGVLFSLPADPLTAVPDVFPEQKTSKRFASAQPYVKTFCVFSEKTSPTPPRGEALFSPGTGPQQPRPLYEQPPEPQEMCLPILSVDVDITVSDAFAFTNVKQTFRNPSDLLIPEARHTFPLYDGAVVTSFHCTIEDVRHLVGIAKPRGQALREFEEAKRNKREATALLQEHTPEIFETALGNIPPNASVQITIAYVHELKVVTMKQKKAEGLLITVPTSIAPRYGSAGHATYTIPQTSLDLWVRVTDDGATDTGACEVESGHRVKYQGIQPMQTPTVASIADLSTFKPQMQAVWHYASEAAVLSTDFIFVLQRRHDHQLHSRALISPTNEHGHAALAVSIRPTDLFGNAVRPESFTGELLFLIDRSGSMGWSVRGKHGVKIEAAQDAMSLVLAGLPETCAFNIISFGSEVRGMWGESRTARNAENMEHARSYVAGIEADMGGTEILLALKCAVENRMKSRASTQIILLTDGEVYSEPNDPIINFVWETRRELGHAIRFFTLGIGDRVSHRIVEGIAGLGGGYCDVVDVAKRPRWDDRLNRLLRSAMEPDSWTCDINLGSDFQMQDLVTFEFGSSVLPAASYIQAPWPVPSLHPYEFKSVFFLLDLKKKDPPTNVLVTTTTAGAKKQTYMLDVLPVASRSAFPLHSLAAKAILLDLEAEAKKTKETNEMRNNAEFLGTAYSVSSRWTAFVAVSDDIGSQPHEIDIYQPMIREPDKKDALSFEVSCEESGEESGEDLSASGSSYGNSFEGDTSFEPAMASFRPLSLQISNDGLRGPAGFPRLPGSPNHASITFDWWQKPVRDVRESLEEESQELCLGNDNPTASPESLTWRDAMRCQQDGFFALPDTMRAKLQTHFCAGTFEKLQNDMRRFPEGATAATTVINTLTDTVMMIEYFKTHLATEEDSWYLIMAKVERAVQNLLGIKEDAEEELAPLNEMLRLSVAHAHFELALKESCTERRQDDGSVASASLKDCRVCNSTFDAEDGVHVNCKAFRCLSDACYDARMGGRKAWGSWDAFWEHQVRSGHLLCLDGS